MRGACTLLGVVLLTASGAGQRPAPGPVVWQVDNLASIGGHAVTVIGAPTVVATDNGPAVAFNGRTDGLVIEANPLEGLSRFTVEVLFAPDIDGPEEQRFLHIEVRIVLRCFHNFFQIIEPGRPAFLKGDGR